MNAGTEYRANAHDKYTPYPEGYMTIRATDNELDKGDAINYTLMRAQGLIELLELAYVNWDLNKERENAVHTPSPEVLMACVQNLKGQLHQLEILTNSSGL
ncbi:hypothetical protein [Gilvimarinus xylanilyticus]|uniref:Uncharacterized protein n=1 Tax=Gilvimarinus xylanilyticus TaxID=2944139 RepID=A0A9X2HYE1_9GAMM|nr:hypothetical protein [Gilvimarinus xylanilyticus]MCP8898771.1 hypothetical protein [Gilvimarinus xylanilyticus]